MTIRQGQQPRWRWASEGTPTRRHPGWAKTSGLYHHAIHKRAQRKRGQSRPPCVRPLQAFPHPCLTSARLCPPDCSSPRACAQLLPRRPPSPHPASAQVAPQPGLPSPPGSPEPILSPAAFFSLHLLFEPTNRGVPKFPYLFIVHLPGRQGAGSTLCSLWRLSARAVPALWGTQNSV